MLFCCLYEEERVSISSSGFLDGYWKRMVSKVARGQAMKIDSLLTKTKKICNSSSRGWIYIESCEVLAFYGWQILADCRSIFPWIIHPWRKYHIKSILLYRILNKFSVEKHFASFVMDILVGYDTLLEIILTLPDVGGGWALWPPKLRIIRVQNLQKTTCWFGFTLH